MTLLQLQNISVEFPGVLAVDDVSLAVRPGEVRSIVGENGAGKSTLVKVLAGVYPEGEYSGKILINDQETSFQGVADAEANGVVMIPQDMNMVDDRSIAENLFLNRVPKKFGMVDEHKMFTLAEQYLEPVGINVAPTTLVGELGTGQKQMVAIASALSKDVKILILDEPTATLSGHESELLFEQIANVAKRGIACLYISHRLEEVLRISDSVTVMRDGKLVDTEPAAELSERRTVEMMIGRTMETFFPEREVEIGETIFEAKGVTVPHPMVPGINVVDDVSLSVRKGEILGVFGLVGAGRTELATALVGHAAGAKFDEIRVAERKITRIEHSSEALKMGYGYLPEDRKSTAVIPNLNVSRNISISNLKRLTHGGVLNKKQEYELAEEYRDHFRIKTRDLQTEIVNLSGGNQQKVMLARLMSQNLRVLILDEPTQGVDVGAKSEIYRILNEAAANGTAIIMISSDLPEIMGMADRVITMQRGRLTGEFDATTTSSQEILEAATLSQTAKEHDHVI